jgi:nucleoside diphosphate kinase
MIKPSALNHADAIFTKIAEAGFKVLHQSALTTRVGSRFRMLVLFQCCECSLQPTRVSVGCQARQSAPHRSTGLRVLFPPQRYGLSINLYLIHLLANLSFHLFYLSLSSTFRFLSTSTLFVESSARPYFSPPLLTNKTPFVVIGKPFFESLVAFMSSSPSIQIVLSKQNAIADWRALIGPRKVEKARAQAPNRSAWSIYRRN